MFITKFLKVLFLLLIFLINVGHLNSTLVWISMDGFRNDYLDPILTPNLYNLSKKGIVSKEHWPQFISKTFPNHFTQATGLYTKHHGIIDNRMFEEGKEVFTKPNKNMDWWDPEDKIRPIWVINQQHGGQSAVIYWTGCEMPFGGITPTFHYPDYNKNDLTPTRLAAGLEKIKSGDFNLVMIFLEDPDDAGHQYGAEHPERVRLTTLMDIEIGKFIEKLKELDLFDSLNFMFSSDHGMIDTPVQNFINVSDLFPNLEMNIVEEGVVFQVNADLETVTHMKEVFLEQDYVAQAFLKDEIPSEYNVNHPTRTPDLMVIAKDGYHIVFKKIFVVSGDHGYPIQISPKMQAFFMTVGPRVNLDATLDRSNQTDLFLIACHYIGIDKYCKNSDGVLPTKIFNDINNGSLNIGIIIGSSIGAVALILLVVLLVYFLVIKKKSGMSINSNIKLSQV